MGSKMEMGSEKFSSFACDLNVMYLNCRVVIRWDTVGYGGMESGFYGTVDF